MDHIEHYDRGNVKLYQRIEAYLLKTGCGPTYFCHKAGVYQSALGPLKKGTIKSVYARKLQDYIDDVDPEGSNAVLPAAPQSTAA